MSPHIGTSVTLDIGGLEALFRALIEDGRELVGPTVQDDAIVLTRIRGVADLPRGVGDEQAPGHYRLRRRSDQALFGFAVPQHSFKQELLVPRTELVQIRRSKTGLVVTEPPRPDRRVAFIGVRACEIAAIRVQDVVLRDGPYADADYASRRAQIFVVAVNCSDPSGTCFCASMGTGPRAEAGFDLAVTELLEPEHLFVVEIGSSAGATMLEKVSSCATTEAETSAAELVVANTRERMGRTVDTTDIRNLLVENLEHPRWDDVADRCLACANCTLACPTCFCTSTEDSTSLDGDDATRTRRWDSCFTMDFAYLHGGGVRPTVRGRYRQWMTHKLATWHDQFGSSGCVGCGRCITWCPVGIDITEEVAAIRREPGASRKAQ
ncbi:Ferredoxin [Labilithrix luteola]|uniref:Ferredoxin n=1 Tax=Labilithrix luteola TaxID=1391654 RepID=A0A0K1PSC4_9BACT|nr:4Fe-4S dicluster domain-containing protein [Labilithrix luteola]AKU96256.1 Ferredoxin [Labilithrix luteola]